MPMTKREFSADDARYMAEALQLAAKGRWTTAPNPAVGCLLVKNGQVIGRGFHQVAGSPHAEIHALREAGEQARGATAYVTLEPCSHHGRTGPCADALIAAGIKNLVCAMSDPNPMVSGQGFAKLLAAGIDCKSGLMSAEAEQLNRGFLKRMRTGKPFVTVKLGMSLDGRIALGNGVSQWITGEAARRDVQRLRAGVQAIITGRGTLLADNPKLTVRLSDQEWPAEVRECRKAPLRVLLDSSASMSASHHLADGSAPTLVFQCAERPAHWPAHLQNIQLERIELESVLDELGRRGCNDVLVEAGPTLSGAFVAAGLVDELCLYMAPMAIGQAGKAALQLPSFTQIADCPRFTLADCRQIGEDLRLTYRPAL